MTTGLRNVLFLSSIISLDINWHVPIETLYSTHMPSTIVMKTTILFQEKIGSFVFTEGIMQQAGPCSSF